MKPQYSSTAIGVACASVLLLLDCGGEREEPASSQTMGDDDIVGDDLKETATDTLDESDDDEPRPSDESEAPVIDPVLFVHGQNGHPSEFSTMQDRLAADGWPPDFLFAIEFDDPAWGCNVDNAESIRLFVQQIQTETGHQKIDLVAHSMGALSSRYFMKNLGGTGAVNTYATLGGLHHGLESACWGTILDVCTWDEICNTGQFVAQLNQAPATPPPAHWVSIYSPADNTVPTESSHLEGAENIEVANVEHSGADGLTEDADVYEEIKRVLQYAPAPAEDD